MALAIQINIRERAAGEAPSVLDPWIALLDSPPEAMTFIRLPGTSASGPCAECAQFFYQRHDGSGRDVPVIPLHPNCVCRDVPLEIAEISEGGAPPALAKGEWLKAVPGKAERRAILGVRKAALLEAGLPVESLYTRQRGPLSRVRTVDETARAIKALPKAKLLALARRMGKVVTRGATRAELVNLLVDKEVL